MNRIVSSFLVLCFFVQNSYAQIESSDSAGLTTNTGILVSLSLSSAFEKYSSFDLGFSKPMKNGNAYGAELGYIYDIDVLNTAIEDSWYQNTYGVKLYFFYRMFLEESTPYPINSKTFIDVEPQLFWASFESETIAGYSCNDEFGDCEYYRFFDSRVERIIPGLNLKAGKVYQYEALKIILFGGLGIRHVIDFSDMNKNPLPDKIFNANGQMSSTQTGTILNLRLGFQVAYTFLN